MVFGLAFPSNALAMVRVDDYELEQGDNEVGGGVASLNDSDLSMVGVTAREVYTDEDLNIGFNGGNTIDNVEVDGSATVDVIFEGTNAVEEVHSHGSSDVTVNASGGNDFEEIEAHDQSNMTVNVTGDETFEEITGSEDANVTIRGTTCQRRDVLNLGAGEEDTKITVERGNLTLDRVTVNVLAREAEIGSREGNVRIDTAGIFAGDENSNTVISAGGKMGIRESVIDIPGTVFSHGPLTIDHSNVHVDKPVPIDGEDYPYRVFSYDKVRLIDQENGEVHDGEVDDEGVEYVVTDDGDGKDEVDLRAVGTPAYERCDAATVLPKTGDVAGSPVLLAFAGLGCLALAAHLARSRRRSHN